MRFRLQVALGAGAAFALLALAPPGTASDKPAGAQRIALEPMTHSDVPAWRSRIESLCDDGLVFSRVRTRRGTEVVVGVSPKGILGFTASYGAGGR